MLMLNFLTGLLPKNGIPMRLISTAGYPLQIKVTSELRAEPMKAKKKIDPAIIRARELKKKKRFEKMIQKQLKIEKQLKPVEEIEPPIGLQLEERKRVVKVSESTKESRRLMLKEWSKVKYYESLSDIKLLHRIMDAQKKALNELKLESQELYEAAVKIDEKLIPLKYNGPVETPPIKEYHRLDGEYVDLTKKWLP